MEPDSINRMKTKAMKIKHMLTALLLAGLTATSCSLEEDMSAFSSPKTFYQNREQCRAGLNSCYIPLKNLYTYQMMLATESVTDLAYANSGTQDAQLDISPAKPRFGANVWEQGYKGVMYCNGALEGIRNSPLSDEEREFMMAEGKIMRAFYYYLLTSFFGDVPFYTVDVADETVLAEVGKLPRMSAVETRQSLIEELQGCVPEMDQIRSGEVENNRSGAAMGWMLIAKMAMWNKDYDTALEALEALEDIYGDFEQYSLDDIPFRYKNTPESIFEIQHTYAAGGLNYSSNVACICMPYPRTANTAIYSGVEIPELGDAATTWSPMRPNGYFSANLMAENGKDKRSKMSVLYGSYNGQKFTDSRPCFGPKFWCPGLQGQYDSNNYKIFRYADAILMIAECYCMKQEDAAKAMEYLNKVKRRAGIDEYVTFRTWDRLMDEIMAERGRELFGEFQRKFDLVRWGNWYQRTYTFTGSTSVKENILPCHEYYPIPDTEVVYSGYALDNKAYAAYGM